eukprot:scaffold4133_cov146-Amphora_coffeaeformis.AAC.7
MSATASSEPPTIPDATGPDPAVMEAIERGNAVVFLDVALGEGAGAPVLGRIKLELFVKDVRRDRQHSTSQGNFCGANNHVVIKDRSFIVSSR